MRALKKSANYHSERSEESVYYEHAIRRTDSSVVSLPQNDIVWW
jgi:hypothetical protein